MSRTALIATALFVLLVPSLAFADNYAIVVGVNACPEFRLPDGSKPRPLRGAEHDADAMAELLTEQFNFPAENVVILKGEAAGHKAVSQAFNEVSKKIKASDLFVFHFSGHGTQLADERPFDELDRLDEALCTTNARSDGTNLIRDDELGLWLDDLQAKRITVILDCCHAGTGIKDLDAEFVPRYLPARSQGKKIEDGEHWRELKGTSKDFGRQLVAFFACQANQQAYERRILRYQPPRRMGQFTYQFTTGLTSGAADADKNGLVSHREILDYVTDKLRETYNKDRKLPAERQEPFREGGLPQATLFR